jgi:hypothetical protein
MNLSVVLVVVFVIALDLLWVYGARAYFRRHPDLPGAPFRAVTLRGRFSPGLTLLSLGWWHLRRDPRRFLSALRPLAEPLLVAGWAFWVGRGLLSFAPDLMPYGIDFPLAVRENYFWRNLLQCGACALWNGNYDGGFPALIDLLGAPLHPLVALPALLFGVINGGKITAVLALVLAGLAQLWIGRTLDLGRPARLWSALMAVAAGSLTGRMEIGQVTLLLSTANGMLWLAALLYFHKRRSNRAAALLALATALLLLSGQGYIQIVVALAFTPALLVFYYLPAPDRRSWLGKLLLAAVLGAACAAALMPLAHNLPAMSKDTNLGYTSVLPLGFQLASLVNPSPSLTQEQLIWGWGMEFQTQNFVSLGPVLLALLSPLVVPRNRRAVLWYFAVSLVLIYLCSTMVLPRLLFDRIDRNIAAGIRHPGVMAGMAGPLILALAAWTVDGVQRFFAASRRAGLSRTAGLMLIILAALALADVYANSRRFFVQQSFSPEIQVFEEALTKGGEVDLPTSPGWIQMPGQHYWNLLAFERGVKLTGTFHPWHVARKEAPPPALIVSRSADLPGGAALSAGFPGLYIARYDQVFYAAVTDASGALTACPTRAAGGWIEVTCDLAAAGVLEVKEHAWDGWRACVDGDPTRLLADDWLAVALPAGRHTVVLRYLPWDAPLGLALSLAGLAGVIAWWRRR